jgi:secondary thiamine-phosphate synthase enzyme
LKTYLETLSFQTSVKQQLIDITSNVRQLVNSAAIRNGMIGIFSQHTTAVLIVNEFQEALLDDIHAFLGRIVEDGRDYKHNSPEFSDCDRHNATSHLRSLIFNNNVLLPLCAGELVLGRFQSVILAELDGPRERRVKVQLMGE